MATENICRDNTVFIKESRSAHAENMKDIIVQGIFITIVAVFAIFLILSCISGIKAVCILICECVGVLACLAAAAVQIIIETRNFRRFTEFIYSMDESGLNGLNAQAVSAERSFDILYMLDEYIYLCPKHVLIPYYDIKDAHFSIAGVLNRRSESAFYVCCHSGKKYIVHLDNSYFKYCGSEDAFKAMLNLKIRKS